MTTNNTKGNMKARTTIDIEGVSHEVTDEFLSHVLATAVEGGCSYWADVSTESRSDEPDDAARPRDFDVSDYLEDDDDADEEEPFYTSASFHAAKNPSEGGTLDLQDVADAISRIAGGEVEVAPAIREIIVQAVQNGDASDIDAEAADCIVQAGLFDEIVYG